MTNAQLKMYTVYGMEVTERQLAKELEEVRATLERYRGASAQPTRKGTKGRRRRTEREKANLRRKLKAYWVKKRAAKKGKKR